MSSYGHWVDPAACAYSWPETFSPWGPNYALEQASSEGVCNWQQEADEKWVQSWLEQKRKFAAVEKEVELGVSTSVKLGELSRSIRENQQLLLELKLLKKQLEESFVLADSEAWELLRRKVEAKKDAVRAFLEKLGDAKTLECLRSKVEQRRRKRERQKRRRREIQAERKEQEKKREESNSRINAWREAVHGKVIKAKREKELKKEADCVLGEVRRKQAEAKKLLRILPALSELRKLRLESHSKLPFPQNDMDFEETSIKLREMMERQLKQYEEEEQLLKVMMEEEREKKSPGTHLQHTRSRLERATEEWEFALLGPRPDPGWLVYRHFYYNTMAERDLTSLFHIRSKWDKFVVPVEEKAYGESVPVGLVIPVEASSEKWAEFLDDSCKKDT